MDQEFDTIFEDGSTAQVGEEGGREGRTDVRKKGYGDRNDYDTLYFYSRYLGRSVSSMTSVAMVMRRVCRAL